MFCETRPFGLGVRAICGSGGVFIFGAVRAGTCLFHVLTDTAQFILANSQFESQASELALHLLVAVFRSKNVAISFPLLQIDFFQSLLCQLQIGVERFQSGLPRAGLVLELHHFGVQGAKLALHA